MRAVRDVVNDGGDELDDHVAVPADEVDERSHVRCAPAGCSWGFLRGSYPGGTLRFCGLGSPTKIVETGLVKTPMSRGFET